MTGAPRPASPLPFAPDEVERYARHLVLREVGGPGQARLRAARVLVVGAGGLGSPCLQYLAAAGVGTLGIADDDAVALSNLQRQVVHGTPDLGRAKVDSAADALARLNPHVRVERHRRRLDAANVHEVIGPYDLVADGTDSHASRALIAEACERAGKPLVSAMLGRFDGMLTTFRPFEAGADGRANPTFRCLFPEAPPPGLMPACEEAGILGALAGVLGSMQALEVLRQVVGFGDGLVRRLLLVDAMGWRFEEVAYERAREAGPPAAPLDQG